MKLQSWVLSILGTVMAAAIIGGGSMIINANSEIKSLKVTDKYYDAQMINFKVDTKADIKEVKDLVKELRTEIRQDNDEIKKMIEQRNERRPR
jgi:site-specific DNA-adenine methylase